MRILTHLAWLLLAVPLLWTCAEPPSPGKPSAVATAAARPAVPAEPMRPWTPLEQDTIHDPAGQGFGLLQQPGEALATFPTYGDKYGEQIIDWVKALSQGKIAPRVTLSGAGKLPRSTLKIMMNVNGGLPIAVFPHQQHTEWLDCRSCHPAVFEAKAGATPVSMLAILEGQYCGKCHGAVAFPITACARCHSLQHTVAEDWIKAGRCELRKGQHNEVAVCQE